MDLQTIINKALEAYDQLVPGAIHEAPKTYEEAVSGQFNKLLSGIVIELHEGLDGNDPETFTGGGSRLMYRLADDIRVIAMAIENLEPVGAQ